MYCCIYFFFIFTLAVFSGVVSVTVGIATAAIEMLAGDEGVKTSRKVEIMADAAYAVLSKECTGQFLIDDAVLSKEGITDLTPYSCVPGNERGRTRENYINTYSNSPVHCLVNCELFGLEI